MDRYTIIVSYQPFDFYQKISVMAEGGNIIFQSTAPIECIADTVRTLSSQFDTGKVLLRGNDEYLKKFKADMMSKFSNLTIEII